MCRVGLKTGDEASLHGKKEPKSWGKDCNTPTIPFLTISLAFSARLLSVY